MKISNNNKLADYIGIVGTSICFVHCIATPLLITIGASFFTSAIFKYCFLIIAFVSIFKATEKTTSLKIGLLLWFAFWGFTFSILFEEYHHWLHYTSYCFSILIITGHCLNIKHCNQCNGK
jgi:hypothetical protein